MRAVLIIILLLAVAAAGGFFYFVHVADQIEPDGGTTRVEINAKLPR